MNSRNEVLIALGANLNSHYGSPKLTLEMALDQLDATETEVKQSSRWWRTPAFPAGSGPDFVNGVAVLETSLNPAGVLAKLHNLEESFGRARVSRWEARVVDLDLIAYGDVVAPNAETVQAWMTLTPDEAQNRTPTELLAPHPRMHERAFVLAPLVDVRPDWRHPLLDRTARELFEALRSDAMIGVAPLEDDVP